jgi:hypothetical protein
MGDMESSVVSPILPTCRVGLRGGVSKYGGFSYLGAQIWLHRYKGQFHAPRFIRRPG